MRQILEIRRAAPALLPQVKAYFQHLKLANEDQLFLPHPMTAEQAEIICHDTGPDYYSFMENGTQIIGYGLLRGWEEGYDVPSLGISIHEDFRSFGLGSLFMKYLHSVATLRKCNKVRLRVNESNLRAIKMYKGLGYTFDHAQGEYLTGFLEL